MNGMMATALLAAGLVIGLLLFAWLRGAARREAEELRRELAAMSAQSQGLSAQMAQVSIAVNQQLGQVNSSLQKGLADSGALVAEAQKGVSGELRESQNTLRQLSERIGEIQQAGRNLNEATTALEKVLGGAKARGIFGEAALERLLEDALPRGVYEMQYRFADNTSVDAIVHIGERLLCIDSKFPLEAYRRLLEAPEEARREFSAAVRKHADDISKKYVQPEQGTLDIALMFVPSETVYYELLVTEDAKRVQLAAYCRGQHVIPVSPNTCYAYLITVGQALRGMQLAQNAQKLQGELNGLVKQLDLFAELYERLGKHLGNARNTYDEAEKKLDRTRNSLGLINQGALPEAAPPDGEDEGRVLPFASQE